jgi:hypothetical protein
MFYLKGRKMVEITTLFATLSMFLAWRLYVVSKRFDMAETMLRGIVSGRVVITRTEDGVEMELKDNG